MDEPRKLTEEEADVLARFAAVEHALALAVALGCRQLSDEDFDAAIRHSRQDWAGARLEGLSPEWSDHISAEAAERFDQLIEEVRSIRESLAILLYRP